MSIQKLIIKAVPVFFLLGILAVGWFVVHELDTTGESHAMEKGAAVEQAGKSQNLITLSDGKLRSANLKIEPVKLRMVQHHHLVPGRIRYDAAKQIDLKAPVSGILVDVLNKPGDSVQQGDLLAVINSPEVGQARADVLKRRSELKIFIRTYDREKKIAEHLEHLFAELNNNKSISEVEKSFADLTLGMYRQQILAAYSKDLLAKTLIKKIQPLANTGSVSGRLIRQRESDQQIASAAYHAICDQAKFSCVQKKLQAESDVADANRRLRIARQSLETMLGYREEVSDGCRRSVLCI